MSTTSGPINQNALIAYARAHTAFQDAVNLITNLYAKQKREYTSVRYISHPLTVGSLLLEAQYSESTMVAAILQDTLSRTSLKKATIESIYGAEVLKKVLALTVNFQGEPAAVLRAYGSQLRAAGSEVQTIKIASLLDLVCAIPRGKLSANAEKLQSYQELLPSLEGGNAELLGRLKSALGRALT